MPDDHAVRTEAAAATLKRRSVGAPLALAKRTSNLFRDRERGGRERLDLTGFSHVLGIDRSRMLVDVEGLTSYEDLVTATLGHGSMPAVVPQLKTITIGGAAAGIGIEATSFRHGLVHDTLAEIEVLLPGGEVVTCRADNEQRDLFFGFPNSYGTLGYALRVQARLLPVKRFVRVEHTRYRDPRAFVDGLAGQCASPADFVDAVVFGAGEQVVSVGRFVDEAPTVSDYTWQRIYYRSLRSNEVDYLTAAGYLWRWDTDWFWCSKNFGAQHPLVRWLFGRRRLNSRTYTRLMRLNARFGLTRKLAWLRGREPESVIQDVDIPLPRAAEFLEFLLETVGILPIWVCPIGPLDRQTRFPLYPLAPRTLYLNFGFWDVIDSTGPRPPGYFNRLIEDKVIELGGIKSLYSDSFFNRATFARLYDMAEFERLKRKYDPDSRAPGLYEKCVLRA
jgi:FAD/FMN-containing dehydrogenase